MPTKEQIDKLRSKLEKWNSAYHNGVELVTDDEYERNRDLLRKYSPKDRFFKKVGADVTAPNMVDLPYMMPSLPKVRKGRGLERWLDNSSGDIAALDKLDGSSSLVEELDNKRVFYSRGNGTVGQNITRMLSEVSGIPKNLPNKFAVRGELMISVSDWKKFQDDYDNPRALTNSQVTSTKKFHAAVKHITFVAHEIVNPRTSWDKALPKLKSLGFKTAVTEFFNDPTPDELEEYLEERKKNSPYELDGLVLIDLKTGKKVSMKKDADSVPIEVDHVQYNISQNSIWKPKVIFTKPVRIGGVMVKQATAHNARYVVDNGIGPGAIVQVIRSGDVIPKVVGVTKKVKPQLPKSFVWNSNNVEAVADKLTDEQHDVVKRKRLVTALVAMNIGGIKAGSAEKLVESGLDNITEILNATEKDFLDAGLGNVVSNKLYTSLSKAKKTVTHAELMQASGLWPKGFTKNTFTRILSEYPLNTLIQEYKADVRALRDEIATLNDFSRVSATAFLKSFAPYIRWVKTLDFRPKKSIRETVAYNYSGVFNGKEFVFTKVRDKNVEQHIITQGGKVSNSITKNTTDLIIKDRSVVSRKLDEAAERGIRVSTLDEFKRENKL